MKKLLLILNLAVIASLGHAQQQFTTFQNASLVIGQQDFLTTVANNSDSITNGPAYCAVSVQGMLAVGEQRGDAVKLWHQIPSENGVACDVRLPFPDVVHGVGFSPDGNTLIASGRTDIFIWKTIPTNSSDLPDVTITQGGSDFMGLITTPDGKLLVADNNKHNITVWNSIPDTNDTPPDYAIGQLDLVSSFSGTGSGDFDFPWGLCLSPDGRLLIADHGNHRVVIYDSVPETYGDTATVVIGQNAFGLNSSGRSDSTMNYPLGVTVTVDGKVAVAEFGNDRVTIWDSIPQSHGEKATTVLGQPDFLASGEFNPSGIADTNNMAEPYAITSDLYGRLFVCGRNMHRVMVFGELPQDSAELAINITLSSAVLCDSSSLAFEVSISNAGPDSAKNIISTTALPTGFNLTQSSGQGSYTIESGYWYAPDLAAGEMTNLFLIGYPDTSLIGDTIIAYANIINSSAIDSNLSNNGTTDSLFLIVAEPPTAPIAADASICSGRRAELSATGEGTLVWYTSANAAFPLGTGSPFTTDVLNTTTSFFVESQTECPSTTRTEVIVATRSCSSNAIEEHKPNNDAMSIYPNPVSNTLTIELPQNDQTAAISLINTMGATIFSQHSTTNILQLDMNDFPAGIYILRVNIENQITDTRIIKE